MSEEDGCILGQHSSTKVTELFKYCAFDEIGIGLFASL